MPTYDVPCLDFRQKLEADADDVEHATDKIVEKSMAYITDLENRVSEQDELILSQSDRIIELKGLLDGGLVELVGELVEALTPFARFACDEWETCHCFNCIANRLVNKAKEVLK